MITEYIQAALRHATYEILPDENLFFGRIPGLQGVMASDESLEACRETLREVLEGWILLRVARRLPIPSVDGIELTVDSAA